MLQVLNCLLVAKCHFQFRSKTSSFKISTVFFKNEKSVNCKLDARYENYLTLFLFFFLNFRGAIRRITLELSTRVVYAKYKVNNINRSVKRLLNKWIHLSIYPLKYDQMIQKKPFKVL